MQGQGQLQNAYAAQAQSNMGQLVGSSIIQGVPVKPITVDSQASTLESYVSQLVELCARAESVGDRLLGGAPATGGGSAATPRAVPNCILDKIDALSRDFSGAIGRMERALQRIGDAL